MTLQDYIKEAEQKKVALGHFNISDMLTLKGILQAAFKLKVPVLIGVSEGERKFLGTKHVAVLIRSLREELKTPVFLNADHCRSLESIKEALEAGYDEIIFDGAQFPFEENVKKTKEALDYVKSKNPRVLVEGELGYIGASSEVLKDLPEGAASRPEDFTSAQEAKEFVQKTGVDLLAPAVGNIHGILASAPNPALDIGRIKAIKNAAQVPLVLHGGSGISEADFLKAIKAGISIIHISTELRKAWRAGVEESFKENPDEVAPHRLLAGALGNIEQVVEKHLRLFSGLGRG